MSEEKIIFKPIRQMKNGPYYYCDAVFGRNRTRLYGHTEEEVQMKMKKFEEQGNPEKIEPLSESEIEEIIIHMKKCIYKTKSKATMQDFPLIITLLIAVTGIQLMDCAALPLNSITDDGTILTFAGDTQRKIYIHPSVQRPLSEYIKDRKNTGASLIEGSYSHLLFLNSKMRSIVKSRMHICTVLRNETEFMGKEISFYQLRKSFIILLLQKGASFLEIANVFGFTDKNFFYNEFQDYIIVPEDTIKPCISHLFQNG